MFDADIKKYDFIDALRGIAILAVILVHSSQAVAATNQTLLWFMNEGSRGVQLFYVASALTLCMSWMSRSANEIYPIRNFYIRRFFRIAPMFYIAIVAYLVINGFAPAYFAPNGIDWWFVPVTALFLHGFHPETVSSVVPGGWSIAVEMSFYLILPFLLPHIKSIKSWSIVFIISLILSGLSLVIVPYFFAYPESQQYLLKHFIFFNFFGQLPVFIIGILGYLVLFRQYPKKQVGIIGGVILSVLWLAFLYPLIKHPSYMLLDKLFSYSHHFIAAGLFSVFAILLANYPIRLLVNRITIRLGKLSFSMYLTHFAILIFFDRLGFNNLFSESNVSSLVYFFFIVIAAAAMSAFSYRYIEMPGITLGKHLIAKLEQNATPISASAAH